MIKEQTGYYDYKAILLDAIHGFIPVNIAEYWLLQTPYLRRLHNIKQLGLSNLVFPSATHTRLNHSLGVMHIASMIANKIINEARSSSRIHAALFHRCDDRVYMAFIQLARIAGLLHDIGHTPLSHMGETALENVLYYKYSNYNNEYKKLYQEFGVSKLHELFTQFFIKDLSQMAREESDIDKLDVFIKLSLFSLRSRDVLLNDIRGKEVESLTAELGLQSEALLLVNQIISNEIADADRLDYLKRDAWFTGMVYGNIDIDRLIYDLTVDIEETPYLVLGSRSIPSLEDVYDARYKMYKYVYYHHKIQAITLSLSSLLLQADSDQEALKVSIVDGIESLKDILNPTNLSAYIKENYTYFDDSNMERLIHRLAISDNKVARRWANALLHKRWLLPISIVKRPDDLARIIIEEVGMRQDGSSPDLVSECINSLVKRFNLIEEHIRDFLEKRGITGSIIIEPLIQKITDVATNRILDKMIRHSIYIKNIMRLGALQLLYIYLYSIDEKLHKRLWSMRNNIVNEFYASIRDVIVSQCK